MLRCCSWLTQWRFDITLLSYADCDGRTAIALAMNRAVGDGRISAPVVISRDHHDVSGTDSPFRETSNIEDGSSFCADMAVQNAIGDSFRGATWVALHNGGGCGWGEVMVSGIPYYTTASAVQYYSLLYSRTATEQGKPAVNIYLVVCPVVLLLSVLLGGWWGEAIAWVASLCVRVDGQGW